MGTLTSTDLDVRKEHHVPPKCFCRLYDSTLVESLPPSGPRYSDKDIYNLIYFEYPFCYRCLIHRDHQISLENVLFVRARAGAYADISEAAVENARLAA